MRRGRSGRSGRRENSLLTSSGGGTPVILLGFLMILDPVKNILNGMNEQRQPQTLLMFLKVLWYALPQRESFYYEVSGQRRVIRSLMKLLL